MTRLPAWLAAAAVLCGVGCGSMWASIRESQRQSSIQLSRDLVERGTCGRAIESLERAQAVRDLGDFAAESVWLKARCLERMGLAEQALAHWRLLADAYGGSRWAERIPDAVAGQLDRPEEARARRAPEAFEIPKPRYGERAQRGGVTGPVWVEYVLDAEGRPGDIRVIGTPHPLIASYAIEAIAQGTWRRAAGSAVVLPRRASTVFRFESLWADDDEPQDGAAPSPEGEASGREGERDRREGIEWFPRR